MLSAIFITYSTNKSASALDGSQFNPGRIIDDSVFYNSNSMSVAQIQEFLDSKMPNCDTNGVQSRSYYYNPSTGEINNRNGVLDGDVWVTTSRAVYGDRVSAAGDEWRGPRAPYTCFNQYRQTTTDIAPESGLCNGYTGAPNESTAQMLYKIAQSCGINPQVMIVLLQKEQSLITDTWPWGIQYMKATGVSCPDSYPAEWAPYNCDPDYLGFFKQMYYGAHRFKKYKLNDNNYNYKAGRNNTIYWHPNTGCGTSTVFIENQATAALYIYTPYRPNQAALNNLYGEGDSCSSYGNRNFWRLFNDWFGSTLGPSFNAEYNTQSPSYSSTAGETRSVYMSFKNTGTAFWKDDSSTFPGYNPVRLATSNVINRSSSFYAVNWLTSNRPAVQFAKVYESNGTTLAADQDTVYPGQIARFEFNLTIPADTQPGIYREYFQPILEGSDSWNLGAQAWIEINVQPTSYKASYVAQSAYPEVIKGYSKNGYFKFKNSGNATWYKNTSAPFRVAHVTLSGAWPLNRSSDFKDSSWPSSSRPTASFTKVYNSNGSLAPDQSKVLPGQIAEFSFTLRGNYNLKNQSYKEYFQPILEGASNWNMSAVAHLNVGVSDPEFKATYVSQSAYPSIPNSQARLVYFKFRNSGNMFWKDDSSTFPGYFPVRLAATEPINRTSRFWHSGLWASSNRPNGDFTEVYESDGVTLAADQNTVFPGQIAKFEFYFFVPPATPNGTYKEHFQPILEGAGNWNMGITTHLYVTVTD